MIWALLYLHFFAGSAGAQDIGRFYLDEAKPAIKAEIQDPGHRKAALDGAANVRTAIEDLLKANRQSAEDFERVYRNYRSSAEEFDAVIGAGENRQRAAVTAIVEARARLVDSVSAEEWHAVIARAAATH